MGSTRDMYPKVQPMLLYKEMSLQDAYDIEDAFSWRDGIKIGIVHTLQ